ncbi:hypothetical protein TREPR_1674 [Treponema primitia ZAS-2]|uniref:Uncharacterized protein n=1 Tax=Treponema primitia (strain ATCC BAA-887 / DSM 12427 / ZAS-2) TaxID=545694 RepID=F5YMZ2_TREPZ|nr:hypothetical protein TREPR_1674 [Treponema primitia ZAS-2]
MCRNYFSPDKHKMAFQPLIRLFNTFKTKQNKSLLKPYREF